MGYYTEFTIIASDEVIEYMEEVDDGFAHGERLEAAGGHPCINAKWYGWEDDMKAVSAHFPDEVIEVRGVGEEGDDVWLVKLKAGEIIYEREFDWSMFEDGK